MSEGGVKGSQDRRRGGKRKGEERNKVKEGWEQGMDVREEGEKAQRLGLVQVSLFAEVMRSRTLPDGQR